MREIRVYAAGPGVFDPQIKDKVRDMRKFCEARGITLVHPAEIEVPDASEPRSYVKACIFGSCLDALESCDYIVANLSPFRGYEPDSGTCWELGYAWASGKQCFMYVDNPDVALIDRVPNVEGKDDRGWTVENLGSSVNTMLDMSGRMFNSFNACIDYIRLKDRRLTVSK